MEEESQKKKNRVDKQIPSIFEFSFDQFGIPRCLIGSQKEKRKTGEEDISSHTHYYQRKFFKTQQQVCSFPAASDDGMQMST